MKLEAAARCRAQGLKTALSRSWLVVVKTAMWLHTPGLPSCSARQLPNNGCVNVQWHEEASLPSP